MIIKLVSTFSERPDKKFIRKLCRKHNIKIKAIKGSDIIRYFIFYTKQELPHDEVQQLRLELNADAITKEHGWSCETRTLIDKNLKEAFGAKK